jgi:acetyl esterase/lipase
LGALDHVKGSADINGEIACNDPISRFNLRFVTGAPKVFISHASEDKDRFVIKFAERLRANGIDPWLDKWEMLPGDSLVDKIFDGIEQAQAVIVVLSTNSVSKRWVREEINAAFVKRVNDASKLIPGNWSGLRVQREVLRG